MSNYLERLKKIIEAEASGKYTVFAKNAGIAATTFRNYMTGRLPSSEHLIRICQHYRINLNWLLAGEGEMYLKTSETGRDEMERQTPYGETAPQDNNDIDRDRMTDVITAVEEWLAETGAQITARQKAALISKMLKSRAQTVPEQQKKTGTSDEQA